MDLTFLPLLAHPQKYHRQYRQFDKQFPHMQMQTLFSVLHPCCTEHELSMLWVEIIPLRHGALCIRTFAKTFSVWLDPSLTLQA